MSDTTIRGRFVWHELLTTDTKSAAKFFSRIVGWKVRPWGEDESYTLFLGGGQQMAGMMVLPEDARQMGQPPSWMSYIGAPNVDDTATAAASLGAKILRAPFDIPTVGRIAIIQDPQGAVFGVYTPSRLPGPEADPAVMDFSWHELATTDWQAALEFYGKLFGWMPTTSMDMGPELGTYQMYGRNGRMLGGMFNKSPLMPGPAAWLAYVRVSDTKKAVAAINRFGGKVISGPMQVPGGDWIAQGIDPQGGMFAVHSTASAAAPARSAKTGPKVASKKPKVAPKKSVKKAAAKKKAAPAKKSVPPRRQPAKKKRAAAKRKRKPAPRKTATKRQARRRR